MSPEKRRSVMVTGATGFLGRQVTRAFERANKWTVQGTGFSRADGDFVLKVDLTNAAEVGNTLDKINPQVVVHCAANRFPDKYSKDPEGIRAINVAATKSLAGLCAARSIFLIYISTDYVFPGRPGDAPYEADAIPKPTNFYGLTLDGELVTLEEFEAAGKPGLGVVLRVPVLYGDAETPAESTVNVLMDVVWKAQAQAQEEDAKIKVDHWALRYPTNTEDVGRVCQDVAIKYLETEDRSSMPKILQFSSEDRLTKFEICQVFGNLIGLSMAQIEAKIEANTEGNDDPNAAVQRPYDCHLSTKALKDLGISVMTQDFIGWWKIASERLQKKSCRPHDLL
ncbi:substrate binding domain-containing protein [Apiospora arundinis]|uniref:NAD(P)-binding protein n=1 Tax=Apiospora arundinis TaxID=335852 RepID=A0ABR2IB00_9PEZI